MGTTPSEKALNLCQQIGIVTLFDESVNGMVTLPLDTTKKIATICVEEIIKTLDRLVPMEGSSHALVHNYKYDYWLNVKIEIGKL